MRTRATLGGLIATLLLVGAACPTNPELAIPAEPPAAPRDLVTSDTSSPRNPVTSPELGLQPYYVAYSAEAERAALAEGRPVLLYFYAAWCPICRAEEPEIKRRVEASAVPVAGFRVDYDSEDELKRKHKIPYQHTTVLLNARGEETGRFTGPMSEAELRDAIEAAAR